MKLWVFNTVLFVLVASVEPLRFQFERKSDRPEYLQCDPPNFDPRYAHYIDFYKRRKTGDQGSQVQCQNSSYCDIREAQVVSVHCRNTMRGLDPPEWECLLRQPLWGYTIRSWTVSCPEYSSATPCIRRGSCAFLYSPAADNSELYVYSGIVGVLGLITLLAVVSCCCPRRKSRTAATTSVPMAGQPHFPLV